MGSNSPGSNPPRPGGLLARLFGMNQGGKKNEPKPPAPAEEPVAVQAVPVADAPPAEAVPDEDGAPAAPAPVGADAAPALEADAVMPPAPVLELQAPAEDYEPVLQSMPTAAAVAPVPLVEPIIDLEPAVPIPDLAPIVELEIKPEPEPQPKPKPPLEAAPVAPAKQYCPICTAVRKGSQSYCDDCGWMFPPEPAVKAAPAGGNSTLMAAYIKDRYELGGLIGERGPLSRYRGIDHGAGQPVPVIIMRNAVADAAEEIVAAEEVLPLAEEDDDDDILPGFDQPLLTATPVAEGPTSAHAWPSAPWEANLIDEAQSAALPAVIDSFEEDGFQYLVEECPSGRSLWDAWDDPEATAAQRFGLLKEIAQAVHQVHQAGAIFENLRPDLFMIGPRGQVMFTDLGDLLPLPLPADLTVRVSLYTAPELVLSPSQVDGRADLYSFGALLYALEYLHHELAESDFERPFNPKLITDRCPDVHPAFFRLISKTFVRDIHTRFPTDEAVKEDATGFTELMRTLDVCGRSFDNVRLDIAAWTTTGMVRTGNEDAFALLHAVESRQDDLNEYALLLLADGMGGYEAGEVAAAMAIQELRKYLLQQPLFAAVAGSNPPVDGQFNIEACKQSLLAGLKHANKEVYTASRTPGRGKRGMGCTAEAVYVDAQNVVVGHVGDSRTYHLHEGRLVQLTRDQTFVNRMVELGALTAEEAEDHPRKNELQQAIGGQPDVVPGLYHGKLKRGDWVLVCSDGLSNHIPPEDLQKMLLREATSAEEAARRLLNLVNLRGATDNATVVIVRAC